MPVRSVVLCLLAAGSLLLAQEPQMAPLNPLFVEYMAKPRAYQTIANNAAEQAYGLIPSPVDLSHLKSVPAAKALGAAAMTYASSYDLRTLGRVTSVKNQNPNGTCWAHATFGSMESGLMPTGTNDFSENNLVNQAGFDWGFNDGGNSFMSMAYLTRWGGPVNETDDPYPNSGGSPVGLGARKHVQQVRIIPARISATANDAIKQAILDYGALYVTYWHDDVYYNSANKSYLYTGAESLNHAVTLVGWDDSFDKSKFNSVPAGNGAFIVKNSWGSSWGESGYFYVSYYDNTFGYDEVVAFCNAEATNNYDRIYQYDSLGWVSDVGFGNTVCWGANLFTAVTNETLTGVGFYANSENTAYELYVYTGISAGAPRSGNLAASQTGTCVSAGYYTLSLNTPVVVMAGQRFSIVLKLTTPEHNFPQPYEYLEPGYSSAATAAAGQSYYSSSGSTWNDLANLIATANFCIKGYARRSNTTPLASNQTITATAGLMTNLVLRGSDADGDTLTFRTNSLPLHGTLSSFNTNSGAISYTASVGYGGTDSFTFVVQDGYTSSTPATVSLIVALPSLTCTVVSAYSGTAPGTVVTNWGTTVSQWVTNSPITGGEGTQYVCVGATVAGNAFTPVSATNVTLMLTNAATVTWLWQTNYWWQVAVGTNGTVTPATGWYGRGSNLLATATPATYYTVGGWSGQTNGAAITSNQLACTMDLPRAVQVWFSALLATNSTPQWWLAQYSLTNGGFNASALLDADSDGMVNWAEYVAGTDPTNATSVLQVAEIRSNSVWFTPALTNRSYAVLYVTNLLSTNWLPLGAYQAGTGTVTALPITNVASPTIFYRIGVQVP
jgi:C1A family cysteine protease